MSSSSSVSPIVLPSDSPLFFNALSIQSQELALRIRYEEMRRDAHVTAVMDKLIGSIVGRDILITAPGEENAKKADVKAAEAAQQVLGKINYAELCTAMADAIYLGASFVHIKDWEKQDKLLIPIFEYMPWWRFTFQLFIPDSNIPVAGNSGKTSNKFAAHLGYELRLLTGRNPIFGERVPEKRFIVYTFGSSSFPFGLGLAWRFFPWYIIKCAARDALIRQGSRVGSPPVIGSRPENFDETNPENVQILSKWRGFLRAVSPNGYFEAIKGFEAEFLEEVKTASPDVLKYLLELSDDQISKAALGEIQQSDTGHGSYSAGESQVDDREANLVDRHCILLNKCLSTSLWQWIGELNYPSAQFPSVRIWTTNEETEEDRLKKEGDRLNATADYWKKLIDIGLKPKPELVTETFGEGWTMSDQGDGLGDLGLLGTEDGTQGDDGVGGDVEGDRSGDGRYKLISSRLF